MRLRIKGIELSSRIGAVIENNVWRKCVYVAISDRSVSSTSSWSKLACAMCCHCRRVNIGKAFAWILEDSRGWRIAFLTPEKWKRWVKIRDKDAWRHTARPHARRFFVEWLCKYYRRRKPNSTQTESFRVWAKQNRFHGWIGYFVKRLGADNRRYRINRSFLQMTLYRKQFILKWFYWKTVNLYLEFTLQRNIELFNVSKFPILCRVLFIAESGLNLIRARIMELFRMDFDQNCSIISQISIVFYLGKTK